MLSITGQAPDALVFSRDGTPLVDARAPAETAACNELRARVKGVESERAESEHAAAMRAESKRAESKRAAAERAESKRAEAERAAAERAEGKRVESERVTVTSSARKPVPSRYASVASQVEARAALRKLGYRAEAAKEAVVRACAHVGADAEVATIVAKVRELDRSGPSVVESVSESLRTPEPFLADKAELARQALVTSGFKRPIAQRAVAAALRHVPKTCRLDELLREALRHCLDC